MPAWAATGRKLRTVPSPRAAIKAPPLGSAVALGRAPLTRASLLAGGTVKQGSRSGSPAMAEALVSVAAVQAVAQVPAQVAAAQVVDPVLALMAVVPAV